MSSSGTPPTERRASPRIPFRQSVTLITAGTTPIKLNGTIRDVNDNGISLTVEPNKPLSSRPIPDWLRRRYSPQAIGLAEGSDASVVFNVPKSNEDGYYRYRAFGQVLRIREELPPAQFSVAMRFSATELLDEV
jgi:hypothetical protein